MCQYRLDPCIIQKLDTIFSTHACFKQQPAPTPSGRSRGYPQHRTPASAANAPHVVERRTPAVHATHVRPKELDVGQRLQRATLGLMNKLSPANKSVIWDKLVRFLDNDSSKYVVPGILDSVVSNTMYVGLIVEFLRRLQDKGVHVVEYIMAFVADVRSNIDEDARFALAVPGASEEYDEFCAVQKQKRNLASKLRFCTAAASAALPTTVADAVEELRDVIASTLASPGRPDNHIDVLFDLCWSTGVLPSGRLRDVYIQHSLESRISNRLRLLTRF